MTFIPQFAVFSAILLAPKLESYGVIGVILTWSVIFSWMAPVQLLWYYVVKKRIENYLSLLINCRPINMAEAREYIIETFRDAKAKTLVIEKKRRR